MASCSNPSSLSCRGYSQPGGNRQQLGDLAGLLTPGRSSTPRRHQSRQPSAERHRLISCVNAPSQHPRPADQALAIIANQMLAHYPRQTIRTIIGRFSIKQEPVSHQLELRYRDRSSTVATLIAFITFNPVRSRIADNLAGGSSP